MPEQSALFSPLTLPCGVTLKNRIAKSAMSDALGDGTGHPTRPQNRLYQRWAQGGLAVSIIGEVQGNPRYAEHPGNLVLDARADLARFRALARAGGENQTALWLQLGHAGALAYGPTSTPKGPSALDLPGLRCAEMPADEIRALPAAFARTARLARDTGFGGVQIHAAHGFMLSQFLSPLFNRRSDTYGGPIANRMRLLLETIAATRAAVGPAFPIGLKLNSSDQLAGGLTEGDALKVIAALDTTSLDLIEISGGTYFPGAKAASDGAGRGPYFFDFAQRARPLTTKPLMLTGGFKTRAQAVTARASGAVDVVGLARALALDPALPNAWAARQPPQPAFPRFDAPPEGGITAWYTMRLADIANDRDTRETTDMAQAIRAYDALTAQRTEIWQQHFMRSA